MKQTEAILGDMRFIPLKGVVLILILILTTSRVHAQYALGATGQMMIPTAEMQETGTFMGSANFLPEEVTPNKFNYPTMNYSVDMSLFSFVELTYRMTLLKMRTYNGRVGYHNQDRSNTIRIRPLKESRYFPAVVIGADDLFTEKATQYWGDYYGVLTKTFGFCKGHQLAVTAGWYFHQGNQPAFKKGPFGGIRYTPAFCRELKLMAEYDIQMIPCCGHTLIANDDLTEVAISGCDTGTDWTTIHEGNAVRFILPSGQEEVVTLREYQYEVLDFAKSVKRFYDACTTKEIPENEFDRNGYTAFWKEWQRRYNDGLMLLSLETGREMELSHDGLHYFVSHKDGDWSLYCEESKEMQLFPGWYALYENARFGDKLLRDEIASVCFDAIL